MLFTFPLYYLRLLYLLHLLLVFLYTTTSEAEAPLYFPNVLEPDLYRLDQVDSHRETYQTE